MKRNSWLVVIWMCAVGVIQSAEPMNILFLSIDDLKPLTGAYGNATVKTPAMDRLAEAGVLFERAYCQQAVCAPSRMSTFTGMRPDQTGIKDLKTDLRTEMPGALTMQEYFIQHGYRSAGAGKVMHGSRNEDPPSWSDGFTHTEDLPFAESTGIPVQYRYQSPDIHAAEMEMKAENIKGWKKQKVFMRKAGALPPVEAMDVPDNAYVDGALATWAVEQLQQSANEGEPFFLTVGFKKPHLPFVAPKKYWDLYDRNALPVTENPVRAEGSPEYAYSSWGELRNYSGIPKGYTADITNAQKKELVHGYYACVSYVDAQVGIILQGLQDSGLADNTIVVVWGDHGWHLGDHGLWCKHTNFEQATRIPLIIHVPGGERGKRVEGVVESVDLFPTLCELAGLPLPGNLAGESLVPALKGKGEGKGFAISQYPRIHKNLMGYSMRTRVHRLTFWMKDNFDATETDFDPALIDAVELYDYQKDPQESRNWADDQAYGEIRKSLEAQLRAYFNQQRSS